MYERPILGPPLFTGSVPPLLSGSDIQIVFFPEKFHAPGGKGKILGKIKKG